MKRLLKPWVVALIAALGLHAALFVGFKDRHWGTETSEPTHLQVSILAAEESAQLTPESESEPATIKQDPIELSQITEPPSQTEPLKAPATPVAEAAHVPVPTAQPRFTLSDIVDATEAVTSTPDWKANSLLDIGAATAKKPTLDPTKDAFSPKFRQALGQAKQVQKEYEKGVVEDQKYPITEDADGTRYVNIKGICWKLPEPGSNEEWQVVLSGCSGQKDTFRFELNITTDLLRSDTFQELPFGRD